MKVVGKKDSFELCDYGDVDDDTYDDLVCHFVTMDLAALDDESTTAIENTELIDKTSIIGEDSVTIVKVCP